MTKSTEILASSYVSYDDAIKIASDKADVLFPHCCKTVTALESKEDGEQKKFIVKLSIITGD